MGITAQICLKPQIPYYCNPDEQIYYHSESVTAMQDKDIATNLNLAVLDKQWHFPVPKYFTSVSIVG